MESKVFEIDAEEKKGKIQVAIWEKKKGISSWVRLGSASLGFLLESLDHCIKNGKGGKWEREWKESGRSYSLLRNENKAGPFLRLGVIDLEKKRHSIIIPKGKGEKGGWVIMAEKLQQMGGLMRRKEHKQSEWGGGNLVMERSYAEVVMKQKNSDKNVVRMKVRKEEIQNNLRQLAHCIIGTWDPSSEGRVDLEPLGRSLAKMWGLKGNLGMARLEENKVLLEFEIMEEATWVMSFGERSIGGINLELERWNPRVGCLEEGEITKEIWVRIAGLPLSLWNTNILKRVGKECGGFIAIDPRTEKMQELRWARILIRTEGEDLPRVMEIVVEEKVYSLALWWELKPALRKAQENRCAEHERTRGEVRGEGGPRADTRVGKERDSARLEKLCLSEERTGDKEGELGRESAKRAQGKPGACPSMEGLNFGPLSLGPEVGSKGKQTKAGLFTQGVTVGRNLKQKGVMCEAAGNEAGPSRKWWTEVEESPLRDGEMALDVSPKKSMLQDMNRGHQRKVSLLASPFSESESNMEEESFKYWVTEDVRKHSMKIWHSATDSTLVEEALRYGSVSLWEGERVPGSSHLIPFLLDRAPEGEHYDRSRSVGEGPQFEVPLCVLSGDGTEENDKGCWEMVGTDGDSDKDRGAEWDSGLNNHQVLRGEKEEEWEESELAKFSLFLGFSTEGLEQEILDFLIKIRKRRERIQGKVLLEKSKFERELKRLECSVNYEKGRKQRDPSQGKGYQITVV